MAEETQSVPETPAFTSEQKLQIREAQVKMLTMQAQARQINEQAEQLAKGIVTHINQLAAQLSVDPKKYSFDIETLTFVPVK